MNNIAKETQTELKIKSFEMAQKFCRLFDDKDKVFELAKEIYGFLASEPEKQRDTFTTKPCHKCSHLRAGRILPNGKSQWEDCIRCGYPKAKKRYIIRCRDCDANHFFEKTKQQQRPKYCPWCASENTFLAL